MNDPDLDSDDLRKLFVALARALSFDALRMKPREKQLALLLASESFGEGSAWGVVDMDAWRLRLATWRSNELKDMLKDWRRAGWIAVDVTEQTYRLAPDQFPGWATVQVIQRSETRSVPLHLTTEDDLHKTFAKISQAAASRGARDAAGTAKISQPVTKISQISAKMSQPGEGREGNVETFNRSDVKRLNVERSGAREACENFAAGPEKVEALKAGVRKFVGEADWTGKNFWNCGLGWRGRLFTEEYALLEGALSYCTAALSDRADGIRVRKTRGAMLWDEFQRLRREHQKHLR